MSEKAIMWEKIEMYCDADRRYALIEERGDEATEKCPTIMEVLEAMAE